MFIMLIFYQRIHFGETNDINKKYIGWGRNCTPEAANNNNTEIATSQSKKSSPLIDKGKK